MPHYIVLANFTDQGVRNIRDFPPVMAEATSRLEAQGIKITRYFTLGEYDIVALIEAPSDEAYARAALVIGSQGNIRTTTLKAFTQEEFVRLIQGLPAS